MRELVVFTHQLDISLAEFMSLITGFLRKKKAVTTDEVQVRTTRDEDGSRIKRPSAV